LQAEELGKPTSQMIDWAWENCCIYWIVVTS